MTQRKTQTKTLTKLVETDRNARASCSHRAARAVLSSLVLAPAAVACSAAFAQGMQGDDAGGYTELDASVVSASGYAQDVRQATASVSVIGAEALADKPVADIGAAVGDVPGVDIDTTKMGNATISIRGFDSAYTLIMVDGRRQNVSTAMIDNGFDPTSTFMPPMGMIERIEVLRGPASTIWGSDAVGGVVNIITKKHPDRLTGSVTLEATLQEHSAYGNRQGASFYFGIPLIENRLSLTLRSRYQRHDETEIMTPPDASGVSKYASHSPTESYTANIGGRLTWSVNAANTLFADLDYSRFKGGSLQTSSKSIQARRWYQKYNTVFGHEGDYDFGRTESYFMINSLALMKTRSTPNDWSPAGTGASESSGAFSHPLKETTSYTLAAKTVMPIDFGRWGGMNFTAGIEAGYEIYEDRTAADVNSRGPFDQTTASVFAEGEYFLSESWSATAGARVHASDIFGSHLAPRAYVVYKPLAWLSFKGGVAAGYKTPNVKQLSKGYYDGTEVGDRTWGNPDLKPEESWSYELSTTADIGRLGQITVGGFYTDFKNLIASEEVSDYCSAGNANSCDQRMVNHGKVLAKGIEVLFQSARLAGFSLTGGYTLTDSEIKAGVDAGKRPNELPRHSLQLRLDYQKGDFNAYVKSSSKFDMVSNNAKSGPGEGVKYKNYTLVDVGASWRINKHHKLALAVNNVLDKDTVLWVEKEGGSGVANAYRQYLDGRNLWLSYTYDF